MVPLATALSSIFALAAFDLSISAHCARGIFQYATYEYIGGFSLLSDICADTGTTQTADIANTHSPAKALHSLLLIICILRDLAQGLYGGTWPGATPVYTSVSQRNSLRLGYFLIILLNVSISRPLIRLISEPGKTARRQR